MYSTCACTLHVHVQVYAHKHVHVTCSCLLAYIERKLLILKLLFYVTNMDNTCRNFYVCTYTHTCIYICRVSSIFTLQNFFHFQFFLVPIQACPCTHTAISALSIRSLCSQVEVYMYNVDLHVHVYVLYIHVHLYPQAYTVNRRRQRR